MMTPPILILDNGAYTIKAGISGQDWEPRVFPNSIVRSRAEKKVLFGDEIENCRDLSGLAYRRPFERVNFVSDERVVPPLTANLQGMLVNWDAEKIIWDRLFSPDVMNVNPSETSLLLTEPYFNLPNIAETYDQMVFEEWEFSSYFRCTPAALITYGGLFGDEAPPPECMVLVDIGYSFTHVIPLRDGQIIWEHVKRIDVGGKLLTNHLKHLISFRQWNMIDQTCIVNSVREACGFVSMNWKGDLQTCKNNPRRNPIVQEYVLPDFSPNSVSRTGYIRSGPNAAPPSPPVNGEARRTKGAMEEDEQVLWMGNERFAGPELLFSPSDIGFKQTGLPETIAQVIAMMAEEVRGMYWGNIGIFGGLGNIEALGERLERDLRSLCPVDCEIGIFEAFDPANPPFHSALSLTASDVYLPTYPVTRAEYLEHGSSICRRRFGGPAYNITPPGFADGEGAADLDDDERERRYAMGLESKKGKGKRKVEEDEVTSGNWGGRRRRGIV